MGKWIRFRLFCSPPKKIGRHSGRFTSSCDSRHVRTRKRNLVNSQPSSMLIFSPHALSLTLILIREGGNGKSTHVCAINSTKSVIYNPREPVISRAFRKIKARSKRAHMCTYVYIPL